MEQLLIISIFFFQVLSVFSQKATVISPNQRIQVSLYNRQNKDIQTLNTHISHHMGMS